MSKYIIEIEEEPCVRRGENALYRAKGFNSLVFDQFGLDKLTPLDKALDEAYLQGKHDAEQDLARAAYDEAYQRGLDDAWEAAKKLFSSMADSDIEKAFPIEWNNGGFNALMNLQPQEAIAKLTAYEEKKKAGAEIKVGDEVRSNNAISDHTGVVLALSPGENSAKVLENDGEHGVGCRQCVN